MPSRAADAPSRPQGYYEPQGGKQPFFISRADGKPIAFAGLWETSRGEEGAEITSGAIVTTAAGGGLEAIHDRMPVFLPAASWQRWLAPEALSVEEAASIIGAGLPETMTTLAVRPLVNSIRNEGEELLLPDMAGVPAPPPPKEPDLFG